MPTATLRLEIVTPEKRAYSDDVEMVAAERDGGCSENVRWMRRQRIAPGAEDDMRRATIRTDDDEIGDRALRPGRNHGRRQFESFEKCDQPIEFGGDETFDRAAWDCIAGKTVVNIDFERVSAGHIESSANIQASVGKCSEGADLAPVEFNHCSVRYTIKLNIGDRRSLRKIQGKGARPN